MDRLFDRLGELLRGLLGENRGPEPRTDPFLREAEEELEEYLRTGRPRTRGGDRAPSPVPDSLRRDFANLDLDPTASFEAVRRAHRRLLARYHPDRYARDPEKQRLATQITQRLNASFRRIGDFIRRPSAD